MNNLTEPKKPSSPKLDFRPFVFFQNFFRKMELKMCVKSTRSLSRRGGGGRLLLNYYTERRNYTRVYTSSVPVVDDASSSSVSV